MLNTDFLKKHYYLLSALLMFLSFPSYDLFLFKGFPFFAWFSLVPIFMFVRGKSIREILVPTFLTFLLGNYLLFYWISAFGSRVAGGRAIVLLFLIPSLTIFFLSKIVIAEFLSKRMEKFRFIIYPSVWICVDWLQSLGFLAFPWIYWGYSQFPFTSFIQTASITGVLGINFLLILANYTISDLVSAYLQKISSLKELIRTWHFKRVAIIFIIVLCSAIIGKAILISNEPTGKRDVRVSMVQTCISPWENWGANRFIYLDECRRYTEQSMKHNPDLIVWSEFASLEKISYDYQNGDLNPYEIEFLGVAETFQKYLISGEIGVLEDFSNKELYPQNSMVYINDNGEVVNTYPKIHLVPFGEWFPYGKWLPVIQNLLYSFGSSNFVPGDKPILFDYKGKKFGNLVCYEGIFYRLCREYKQMGADFLVNITNDGWSNTYSGHIQHFASSVFRAIENGIWYVRVGNTGYTALIDPYGRIIKSLPILKKGYLVGDMDFSQNHDTIYTATGDLILYASLIFIFALFMIVIYNVTITKNET